MKSHTWAHAVRHMPPPQVVSDNQRPWFTVFLKKKIFIERRLIFWLCILTFLCAAGGVRVIRPSGRKRCRCWHRGHRLQVGFTGVTSSPRFAWLVLFFFSPYNVLTLSPIGSESRSTALSSESARAGASVLAWRGKTPRRARTTEGGATKAIAGTCGSVPTEHTTGPSWR